MEIPQTIPNKVPKRMHVVIPVEVFILIRFAYFELHVGTCIPQRMKNWCKMCRRSIMEADCDTLSGIDEQIKNR